MTSGQRTGARARRYGGSAAPAGRLRGAARPTAARLQRLNGCLTDADPSQAGGRRRARTRQAARRPTPAGGPGAIGPPGANRCAIEPRERPQKRVRLRPAAAHRHHSLRAGGLVDGAVSAAAGVSPEIGFGPGWLRSHPALARMAATPTASVPTRAMRNIAIGKRITVPPDARRRDERGAARRRAVRLHSSS